MSCTKHISMRKIISAIHLTLGLIAFFTIMLIVLPFIVLFSYLPGKYGAQIPFALLRFWSFTFAAISGFYFTVKRNKNVKKDQTYIYVCNHGSYLDAPAVVLAAPNAFKPLGKIEMSKIPFFGFIYTRVVVTLNRSDKESRAASVEKLKKVLADGISILIFPEGTMNTTPNVLKEFYDGAFRIAIETQTPIAPFVLINSRELMPRKDPFAVRPGIIKAIFADPISVNEYTIDDLEKLKTRVYNEMERLILSQEN